MANDGLVSRESEAYGSARVVKRSRLFFTVPIVIITAVSMNFVWEVIRTNINPSALVSGPFRFTIISASTTATVLAVFVSLFMGRLQWARALRPCIGAAIDDEGARFQLDSDKWRLWIYNAGPGAATFNEISYYVRFADQPETEGLINWVPLPVVNDQLKSRRLDDGADYFIRWNAKGAPLPVVKNYSEGMQLAWFTVEALAKIRVLDVRLRYVDSLGDLHEKITPLVQRLPSVTVTAINNALSKSTSSS